MFIEMFYRRGDNPLKWRNEWYLSRRLAHLHNSGLINKTFEKTSHRNLLCKYIMEMENTIFVAAKSDYDYRALMVMQIISIGLDLKKGTSISDTLKNSKKVLENKDSFGYCCGQHSMMVCPNELQCWINWCRISRGSIYYSFKDKYIVCTDCFNAKSDFVTLKDCMNLSWGSPVRNVLKTEFVKKTNDKKSPEPLIACKSCSLKFHAICLYVNPNDKIFGEFICPYCQRFGMPTPLPVSDISYRADQLPESKASKIIQSHVDKYLEYSGSDVRVIIRMVCNSNFVYHVKEGIKKIYPDFPDTFPYTKKVFYVFQEIEGKDVAVFCFHVHEYGNNCPEPNRNRVYISYLDSVKYFQPSELRSIVFQQSIIGYLNLARLRGYKFAHIWVCPPAKGLDYIFNCHPEEQIIPSQKRLLGWYNVLLDSAIKLGIVLNRVNIRQEFIQQGYEYIYQLPYFKGDHIPNVVELNAKKVKTVTHKDILKKAFKANCYQAGVVRKPMTTINLPPLIRTGRRKGALGEDKLTKMVLNSIKPYAQNIIVARLKSPREIDMEIDLEDPQFGTWISKNRYNLFEHCRRSFYEFCTLRKAIFSTSGLIKDLLTLESRLFTCILCKRKSISDMLQCGLCKIFIMCVKCGESRGRRHMKDGKNCPGDIGPIQNI